MPYHPVCHFSHAFHSRPFFSLEFEGVQFYSQISAPIVMALSKWGQLLILWDIMSHVNNVFGSWWHEYIVGIWLLMVQLLHWTWAVHRFCLRDDVVNVLFLCQSFECGFIPEGCWLINKHLLSHFYWVWTVYGGPGHRLLRFPTLSFLIQRGWNKLL